MKHPSRSRFLRGGLAAEPRGRSGAWCCPDRGSQAQEEHRRLIAEGPEVLSAVHQPEGSLLVEELHHLFLESLQAGRVFEEAVDVHDVRMDQAGSAMAPSPYLVSTSTSRRPSCFLRTAPFDGQWTATRSKRPCGLAYSMSQT